MLQSRFTHYQVETNSAPLAVSSACPFASPGVLVQARDGMRDFRIQHALKATESSHVSK